MKNTHTYTNKYIVFVLFNGISTFMDYLMPKNNSDTILPIAGRTERVRAFLKGISLKVNVIKWVEFKLLRK